MLDKPSRRSTQPRQMGRRRGRGWWRGDLKVPQVWEVHFREDWHSRTVPRDVQPKTVNRFMDVGEVSCRCGERREEVFLKRLKIFLDFLDGIHVGHQCCKAQRIGCLAQLVYPILSRQTRCRQPKKDQPDASRIRTCALKEEQISNLSP